MNQLIINYGAREKRAAYLKDGKVERIELSREDSQTLVGSIFLGIVTKVLPGMNAAFVDIGTGRNAYLHRDALASFVQSDEPAEAKAKKSVSSYVSQGERLLVQVEKDPVGTKGAKVTGILEFGGAHLVYMPQGKQVAVSKKMASSERREQIRNLGRDATIDPEGVLFRTSSEIVSDEDLLVELDQLREEASVLFQKAAGLKKPFLLSSSDPFLEKVQELLTTIEEGEVMADDLAFLEKLKAFGKGLSFSYYSGKPNIFDAYGTDKELDKLLRRVVWLENGGYLLFEETETLIAIDVNTGKFSGKNNLRETVLKTNLMATEETARQIRLRDLAGIILIDFIDMKQDHDRELVAKKMEAELKKDWRRTRVAGFTSLGILQITRRRVGESFGETLTVKCPSCEGTGRVSSPETVAFKLERELWEYRGSLEDAVLIEATEQVRSVFSGEGNIHLNRIEKSLGMKIIFSVAVSPIHFYKILQFGSADELKEKARKLG
ncbi:axial filament protein [Bacillus sp. FJAT-18017]|uniref:Rne/Rng family ribonuclease n=1 Tax=Bacillus sp. FJAT-18017 TaxID=1705566 RepID=UPI0006ADBF05|nr:Rne/Rng family ribonuclease [Bacillus sp. FJAT-18017]ALC89803.1 axial filament protein [Bacillus sp. FJAT-18017]